MYAIIETGGKQYRVGEGETVRVEKLPGGPGETITFDRVLMVGGGEKALIGRPVVEGAKVEGEILATEKARKVVIGKYKRRKNYERKAGHRQILTALKIKAITTA